MSEGGGTTGELGRFWRNASQAQRVGMAAFAAICLGLIALVASAARKPQYAVLYGGLEQEEAAAVVQRLRDMKVPYRVGAGATIEAPADAVAELRLDLAADGLPAGGQDGFELLDRARLGLTEFGERHNYQRALQGELARTIAHLEPVAEARVHIAVPQERLYVSEQEKPSASIVLKLRGAATLNSSQVKSIVHLVSGAVEGLAPEAVAVMDTRGRLLSNPDEAGAGGAGLAAASSQLELRRQCEREMEGAVQSMLDGVLGVGKSMVRASVQMSFDQVEREVDTYESAADGSGVLESRRETREMYHGLTEPRASGLPGVSANTGQSPMSVTVKGRPGADEYEQSEVTSQYLVSRARERRKQPPGQIKQVSLSVMIDQEAELGEVKDLTGAVSAAAGLDPQRGDVVVITRLPFQTVEKAEDKGSRADAVRDFYLRVGRDFVAIILAALFLKFAAGMFRRGLVAPRAEEPTLRGAPGTVSGAPAAETSGAEIDPEKAASVLRTWLSADEAAGDNGGVGRTAGGAV